MIYCSKCGMMNSDDSQFCKKRGAQFGSPESALQHNSAHFGPLEHLGKGKAPFASLIIISLLTAIGLLGFLQIYNADDYHLYNQLFWAFLPILAASVIVGSWMSRKNKNKDANTEPNR